MPSTAYRVSGSQAHSLSSQHPRYSMPASSNIPTQHNALPRQAADDTPRTSTNHSHQSDLSHETLRQSTQQHSTHPDKRGHKKKKSGSGMFGFLTLKEPSTLAWEEMAEQQKKVTAQSGGRARPVGLPGVSSQKLPDHVPKVNSKWDGLPENLKRQNTDRSHRGSGLSSATRQSVRSETSFSSDSSGKTSQEHRNWNYASRPMSRPQSGTLLTQQGSPHTYFVSDSWQLESHSAGAQRSPKHQSYQSSPKVSRQPSRTSAPSGSNHHKSRKSLEVPRLSHHDSSSSFQTSPEASPQTPGLGIFEPAFATSKYATSPGEQTRAVPNHTTQWLSDTDDERSSKPTAAPKPAINFSRPGVKPKEPPLPNINRLSFVHDEYKNNATQPSSTEGFVFFDQKEASRNPTPESAETTFRRTSLSPIRSIGENETTSVSSSTKKHTEEEPKRTKSNSKSSNPEKKSRRLSVRLTGGRK